MMLSAYKEKKKTGYDWLPEVPAHWEQIPIWTILSESDERNGERDDLELLSVYREYGVIKKASRSDNHNVASQDLSNYKYVGNGYLVMNKMKMWQGSLGVSKYEGIVSPAYIVCKMTTSANKEYLHYLLRSVGFKTFYNRISYGIRVGQWDMRYGDFKKLCLFLPTIDEQNRIVSFLNWKTAEMVKFVHEKEKEISLLNELKHSIIVKAVTNGIKSDARMVESTISFIKEIPEHWDELMLFQVASEQKFSNKTVHHQNLLSLSYGKIKRKDINTKGGLLPASFDTYQIVNNGNVIMRLTDLQNDHKSLRVGLATETGIITSAYTCLQPRDNILPAYLYLMLHAYDVSKVFYGMGGGVRQSIGYADIRRMTIPLPPLGEQQAIVDYCYAEQEKIEKLIDSLNDEIAYIQELRVRTISDVVTGKVDVRDVEIPEYETKSSEIEDDISDEEISENVETVDEEVDE